MILARIAADSPRAADWARVFGTDCLPLESGEARPGALPGLGVVPCSKVRTASLTLAQRWRLVGHLATRFGLPKAEVAVLLDGPHGLPIPAEDATAIVPGRAAR